MRFAILLPLLAGACADPSPNNDQAARQAEEQAKPARIAAMLKRGDITLSHEHPRPDLSSRRWFKVEDQYGCKWWIDSGNKYDTQQIDVRPDGEANCTDPKHAPEKLDVYRDRKGEVVGYDEL